MARRGVSSSSNRPLRAVAIAALFALVGLGATGYATNHEVTGTVVDLSSFSVPPRHVGDRGIYVPVDPETGVLDAFANSTVGFSFAWKEPGELYDPDGRHHAVETVDVAYHTETTGADHALRRETLHFDRFDGGHVAYGSDRADPYEEEGFLGQGVREHGWNSTWTYLWDAEQQERQKDSLPCLLRHSMQGAAVDLAQPLVIESGCSNPATGVVHSLLDPLDFEVAYLMDGLHIVDFKSDDGGLRYLRFREDVPYPILMIKEDRDGRLHTLVLVDFERGDAPFAEPAPPRPDLPPIVMTEPPAWGIDDHGIDHPFPLSEAWNDAMTDPRWDEFRRFVDQRSDAYVTSTWFWEMVRDGHIERQWHIDVAAGDDVVSACPSRTSPGTREAEGPGLLPLDGFTPITGCGSGIHPGVESVVPKERPTVASMRQIWDRLAPIMGADLPPLDYGARVMVDGDGRVSEEYRIGTDTSVLPEASLALSPAIPVERVRHIYSIRFDEEGRLAGFSSGRYDDRFGPATESDDGGGPAPADARPATAVRGWSLPPGDQAVVVGILALGLALLYWLFPTLKQFAVGAYFSRIERPRVLDHERRARILEIVQAEPGIHSEDLRRRTGLAQGTLQHHVRKLVETGVLVRRRVGGYTCYHAPGAADAQGLEAQAVGRSAAARRILAALEEDPSLSGTALAERLGMSRQSVHYHLKRLRASGLVS